MINSEKSFNISDYIDIFLKRIWYIVIPFVIVLSGTILYALSATKEYRATTLILVIPQRIPEAFVRATVTSKIAERLTSISQEITSRTRLEQIISEFQLYSNELKSKTMEEIVATMKNNIQVDIKGKEGKEGYMSISYIGKNPRLVTTVTNKLASLFIEENLKLREEQAQGTSEFLAVELKNVKAKIDEQEKALTHYKKQFIGELPEQREANLRMLEQLQFAYKKAGEDIRAAQDRKLIIQKQLSDTELLLAAADSKKEEGLSSSNPVEIYKAKMEKKEPQLVQLDQFKSMLAELQAKYTEKHPDILVAKRRIAELEAKIEKEKSEKEEAEKTPEDKVTVSQLPPPKIELKGKKEEKSEIKLNPRYKEMEAQLIATELEIVRRQEEEEKIKAQINQYRERVENAPMRELAMTQLSRDYGNTKETYQSLLKKNEESQQAENLERRQKGEQFKVIDPARIPQKPYRPDIPKILLIGVLLSLGSGLGLAFFREQMDHSFRDAEDLEATLGFKVLANIPKIEKKAA